MTRRLGGEFELALEMLSAAPSDSMPKCPQQYTQWLNSGRSAIYMALREALGRGGARKAWLPAYCCESVIAPFKALGFQVHYYSMGKDLATPSRLPERLAGETVLYIHYFGFRNEAITKWLDGVPRSAAYVIEDCVQASLNANVGGHGDFSITSLRKVLAQPDGAQLASSRPFDNVLPDASESFISHMVVGKLLRYASPAASTTFLKLFEDAESMLGDGSNPSSISWLSNYIMRRTNFPDVASKRRKNWELLSEALSLARLAWEHLRPLYGLLPEGVVPLGFPVRVEKGRRDGLRKFLGERNIFCPIHWRLPHLPAGEWKDEHDLAESILTLPIDQRMGEGDIQYLADALCQFFERLPLPPTGYT